MISRKIFAEGMAILNEKLGEAMKTLDGLLHGQGGIDVVRQQFILRNAPLLHHQHETHAIRKGEIIKGVSESLELKVIRATHSTRLGGGFDKLNGMSTKTYDGLRTRLTISKLVPDSPLEQCGLKVGGCIDFFVSCLLAFSSKAFLD